MIQHNYFVVLVAGKAVKDNRELLDGRWDKNDNKDSANAADLVSPGIQLKKASHTYRWLALLRTACLVM